MNRPSQAMWYRYYSNMLNVQSRWVVVFMILHQEQAGIHCIPAFDHSFSYFNEGVSVGNITSTSFLFVCRAASWLRSFLKFRSQLLDQHLWIAFQNRANVNRNGTWVRSDGYVAAVTDSPRCLRRRWVENVWRGGQACFRFFVLRQWAQLRTPTSWSRCHWIR